MSIKSRIDKLEKILPPLKTAEVLTLAKCGQLAAKGKCPRTATADEIKSLVRQCPGCLHLNSTRCFDTAISLILLTDKHATDMPYENALLILRAVIQERYQQGADA